MGLTDMAGGAGRVTVVQGVLSTPPPTLPLPHADPYPLVILGCFALKPGDRAEVCSPYS